MTALPTALERIEVTGAAPPAMQDVPRRRGRYSPGAASELVGAGAASLMLVVLVFALAGILPNNVAGNVLFPQLFGITVCWLLAFLVLYGTLTYLRHDVLLTKDRLATLCICIGASIALFPLIEIIFSVLWNGVPVAFSHFPAFFVHDMSHMAPADPVWKGGVGHAIIGTVEQVGLATVYTVPISLLTATYLSESSSRFSGILRSIVDVMMGIPSIIAGLFVYLFWVQPRHTAGFSGFAASIALAILMLPIMIRTAEEVIRVVPGAFREAALALGSPRWRVSLMIVIPTVRSGLLTAVILGIALAVGETAPALFTAGNSHFFNVNAFAGRQSNLPLHILEFIRSPNDNLVRVAWGGAFILVALVLVLFVVARLIGSSQPGKRRLRLPRRTPKEVVIQ